MRWYRLYCVSTRGSFVDVRNVERETDADARASAEELLSELPKCDCVEIWQGARLVGQVGRHAGAAAPAEVSA